MRQPLFQRRGAGLAPPTEFAATVVTLPPPSGLGGDDADGAGASRPPGDQTPRWRWTAPPSIPAADSVPDAGDDPDEAALHERPTLWSIGRYAVKGPLGSGGVGQVWEAWDPLLSRAVALKTLPPAGDDPARGVSDAMFLHEARAAAGLNHPHIVTVHDAGLAPQGLYLAMERLHGRDLRRALAQGWRPTPWQAAQLVRRVADALAYAHERGVVHCDIKPSNIFLDRRGRPKLLDFGIARLLRPAPGGGTVAAAAPAPGAVAGEEVLMGSPHYLAPEQLIDGSADARTDLYGLGLVLYELLTGRRAHDGDSMAAITASVLDGRVPPAHRLRPGVPPDLSAIAERAMARDPAARWASAGQMGGELRRWNERHRRAQAVVAGAAAAAPAAPLAAPARRVTAVPAGVPTTVPLADDEPAPSVAGIETAAPSRPGARVSGRPTRRDHRRPRWHWATALLLAAAGGAAWVVHAR